MTDQLDTPPPIQVTDQTIPDMLATAGRYILASGGAYALGKGWIDGELLNLITGLATVLSPIAYAIWKTRNEKRKLITAANAAPESVATVVAK